MMQVRYLTRNQFILKRQCNTTEIPDYETGVTNPENAYTTNEHNNLLIRSNPYNDAFVIWI